MLTKLKRTIESHRYTDSKLWRPVVRLKDLAWGTASSYRACQRYYLGPNFHLQTKLNFLIIGAMKSGTSTLYNYLGRHSDIYVSVIKEPGFFLDGRTGISNLHHYLQTHQDILELDYQEPVVPNGPVMAIFNSDIRSCLLDCQLKALMFQKYNGEKIIGEGSTHYTRMPLQGQEAPVRIHRYNSQMKFVYLVRNPVDRIISQYFHHLRIIPQYFHYCGINQENFKVRDLTSMVKSMPEVFLAVSRYHYQLSHYLKYFPQENFRVIVFEEFIANPQKTLQEIFNFLGVADNTITDSVLTAYNQSPNRDHALKLSRDTHRYLIDNLRPDIEKLEKFLGRRLDIWDLSADKWC